MKDRPRQKIKQEVYDLYDDYAHNRLDRRQFVDRLSTYAVGGITIASLLSAVMPNYQDKIQIDPDDPRLKSEMIEYLSAKGGGAIKGQLSRPVQMEGKLPDSFMRSVKMKILPARPLPDLIMPREQSNMAWLLLLIFPDGTTDLISMPSSIMNILTGRCTEVKLNRRSHLAESIISRL